jgi:glyoxylase-like metal-dependent hydrolase (beta-lactamase superfamily II)
MAKLVKISDNVFCLPGMEGIDQPFLYYIKGNDYSIAIDAGNCESHVKEYYQELHNEGLELPKYTVITHWHWDHTFGMPYVHGKTIASELTNRKLKVVSHWKWTLEEMKMREQTGEDITFCNECICKVYEDLSQIYVTPADIEIDRITRLDLGGVTLSLIPRDSTHSRDALFVFFHEEKMLFVGDADCEDHYDENGAYNKERLKSLITFIEEIDFESYLLGHDFPSNKEETLEYLNEKYKELFRN